MTSNDISSGVSSCFVFKSRLQEYAQKYKLPTPVYETVKEGPSHESTFQSTVIVDGVRYNSVPGFANRKAAEQSAAEVALHELAKSSDLSQDVSQPIHETGLCKNLLQEYAQKMNYAVPLYHYQKSEKFGRNPQFTCTIEIGGMKYIGAASKSKKDAERSAGRTALLVIESDSKSNLANCDTQLTVLPCKKTTLEEEATVKETIETTQPSEDGNNQSENIDTILNLEPSGFEEEATVKETTEIPKAKKKKSRKRKRKVAATEDCQNDQSENIETTLNVEPPLFMSGFEEAATVKETIETPKDKKARKGEHTVAKDDEDIIIIRRQPTDDCGNDESENIETTLDLEASLWMNGFEE